MSGRRSLLFSTLVLGCAQLNEPDASVMTDAAPPSASGTATGFFESFDIVSSAAFGLDSLGSVGVLVTSAEDLCRDFDLGVLRPNAWALALFAEPATPATVLPGTYEVGTGRQPSPGGEVAVGAFVVRHDSACNDTIPFSFVIGTGEVVFSEISDSRIRGSFDVYFGEDRLFGEFDSPRCLPHGRAPTTCER